MSDARESTSSEPASLQPVSLQPGSAEQAADMLRGAAGSGLKLMPQGRGTRSSLGALPRGLDAVLSTAHLDQLLAYEPGDMTFTAQSGLGLAELDDALAEHGQWLPLQCYRRAGSLGGLLASAADGVLDLGFGRPRDVMLGARVALADGLLARSRGRVVKNVAGYDIPRLMTGSHGTLGVLLEASLKVLPRPARHSATLLGFDSLGDALLAARRVHDGPDEPSFLNVLGGACAPQLALGFDGSELRVETCQQRAIARAEQEGATGRLLLDEQACLRLRRRLDDPIHSLRPDADADSNTDAEPDADPDADNGHATQSGHVLVRWSGRPSQLAPWLDASWSTAEEAGLAVRIDARPALGLAFVGLSNKGDHETLMATTRAVLAQARSQASAVLLDAPDALRQEADDVWGPPGDDLPLMQRTRDAVDPSGVFSCGRFVGGM